MLPRLTTCVFAFAAAMFSAWAAAFAVFPFQSGNETLYLKWGDNHGGTSGGVVAWSLVPAGTQGSAFCGNACPGASLATIPVENSPGGGFTPRTLAELRPRIVAVLARWSAATDIRFVEVADSGLPINDASAVPPATGHIRIAIFDFASGGGAVGYAAPPNGGTGAGDVILDSGSFYQFAPGAEGDTYDTTFAPNDFDGLLLHELGHAMGFAHPPFDGSCPVMQVAAPCLGRINRELDADDLAGASFLYGPVFGDGFE